MVWKQIMSLRALIRLGHTESAPYIKIMKSRNTIMKLECLRVLGFYREKSVINEIIDLASNIDSVVTESLDFYYFPIAKEILKKDGILGARRNYELEEIITSIGYIGDPRGLAVIEEALYSTFTYQEYSYNLLIACIDAVGKMPDGDALRLLNVIEKKICELEFRPSVLDTAILSALRKKQQMESEKAFYDNGIPCNPLYDLVLEREKDDFNVTYPIRRKRKRRKALFTPMFWFRGNIAEAIGEFHTLFPNIDLGASHFHNSPPDLTLPGPWRKHPLLKDKFHPTYPNDVQVMIHEGGPHFSANRPEVVWVAVNAVEGDVFTGRVLNRPNDLMSVKEGDEISFVVPQGGKFPIRVSQKYVEERSKWVIRPCNKCGLTELFDAPSDLLRVMCPDTTLKDNMALFSTFCGACGGMVVIHSAGLDLSEDKISQMLNGQPAGEGS